jgi:hypothetical protein
MQPDRARGVTESVRDVILAAAQWHGWAPLEDPPGECAFQRSCARLYIGLSRKGNAAEVACYYPDGLRCSLNDTSRRFCSIGGPTPKKLDAVLAWLAEPAEDGMA